MNLNDLIRNTRSIRRFRQGRPLSREDLTALVDSARLAPCGANLQLLRFSIVNDEEGLGPPFLYEEDFIRFLMEELLRNRILPDKNMARRLITGGHIRINGRIECNAYIPIRSSMIIKVKDKSYKVEEETNGNIILRKA